MRVSSAKVDVPLQCHVAELSGKVRRPAVQAVPSVAYKSDTNLVDVIARIHELAQASKRKHRQYLAQGRLQPSEKPEQMRIVDICDKLSRSDIAFKGSKGLVE